MSNTVANPDSASNSLAKDVVLFDGECRFCRSQIAILRWLDWFKRLEFVSLHDSSVISRFPDLSYDQLMEQMWVVTPEGEQFGGANAVRYLTRSLPSLYLLAPLLHIPGSLPVWSFLYRCVARLRYRIAGKSSCENGTCEVHFGKKAE